MNPQEYASAIQRLRKYPHMLPADVELWNRFLDHNDFPGATVAYDVHVGTPAHVPPGTQENYARMIVALSTYRIDAVLYLPDETAVVEVKPHAGPTAIGQVLSYTLLFRKLYPQLPTTHPIILTDTARPDTPYLCAAFNITLIELDQEHPK